MLRLEGDGAENGGQRTQEEGQAWRRWYRERGTVATGRRSSLKAMVQRTEDRGHKKVVFLNSQRHCDQGMR